MSDQNTPDPPRVPVDQSNMETKPAKSPPAIPASAIPKTTDPKMPHRVLTRELKPERKPHAKEEP
jgi:hypothetical protein